MQRNRTDYSVSIGYGNNKCLLENVPKARVVFIHKYNDIIFKQIVAHTYLSKFARSMRLNRIHLYTIMTKCYDKDD